MQVFSLHGFSRTLRVMDVCAENRGRPHKNAISCGPGDGENTFGPLGGIQAQGSGYLQDIRTKEFLFMFFSRTS